MLLFLFSLQIPLFYFDFGGSRHQQPETKRRNEGLENEKFIGRGLTAANEYMYSVKYIVI